MPTLPTLPFFAGAFFWNVGLGMTYILVPLYAYELGYSGVEIGTLIATPTIFQLVFSLIGGAYVDRLGGKRLAVLASVLLAVGGLLYLIGTAFPVLLLAQLAITVSRATFWPATWSLGSELPGDRSVQMGWLNSTTGAGQIAGTLLAGLLLAHAGFAVGFTAFVLLGGVLSAALTQRFDAGAPRHDGEVRSLVASYAELVRKRWIYFALACSYLAALPFSLSFSFYPILLVHQGYASDVTGLMVALRGVGSVVAGVMLARLMRPAYGWRPALAAGLAVGLAVLLVSAWAAPSAVTVFLFLVGLGSGAMILYFQLFIAERSSARNRGSSLAMGGLGWSLSHLSTPLAMGFLTDRFGIETAFHGLGAFAMLWALCLVPMHRWVTREPPTAVS